MRETLKSVARAAALVLMLPALASYAVRACILGKDRALEGSTQALALVPGVVGQYLRQAFLGRTLAYCDPTATISYGTLFSQAAARIERHVYIGAHCHLGRVHLEPNVLVGSGVHITSGRHTHATGDLSRSIREQGGERSMVRIGTGAWIGSAAVVMADVGAHAVVGAGAVVTRPLPDGVVAGGVPARVIRAREQTRDGDSATP